MAEERPVVAEKEELTGRSGLTPGQHRLASIGDKTKAFVEKVFGNPGADPDFLSLAKWEEHDISALADALMAPWTDVAAASLLEELGKLLQTPVDYAVDGQLVAQWVKAHANKPDLVMDCAKVVPPEGFTILEAMSKKGSQKRVFLARWKQAQREVVLKQLLGDPEKQEKLLGRELQTHPLAMQHPNIITTHPLTNDKKAHFLVEEKLPFVLSDSWRASGVHEATNLLHDIAQALSYLHGELRRVHGDIKPDNIGQKDGAYILLDFGICREECDFRPDLTATGSLRTRAPELFPTNSYANVQDPFKLDVWSLGVTVFRTVTGRYPFIDGDEDIPRISTPKARAEFEKEIAGRIENEWNQRVNQNLAAVPEPLRYVLGRVMVRAPGDRPTAKELVGLCRHKLAGYLSETGPGGVTAEAELDQLLKHLHKTPALRLMPAVTKQQVSERLRYLKGFARLVRGREKEIEALLTELG